MDCCCGSGVTHVCLHKLRRVDLAILRCRKKPAQYCYRDQDTVDDHADVARKLKEKRLTPRTFDFRRCVKQSRWLSGHWIDRVEAVDAFEAGRQQAAEGQRVQCESAHETLSVNRTSMPPTGRRKRKHRSPGVGGVQQFAPTVVVSTDAQDDVESHIDGMRE